ncbi:MAG: DUF3341 domain-containing protein [Cytophagales bacterium]|nr:DUF3341 domain-containing protein [Cytophagales bacterium]
MEKNKHFVLGVYEDEDVLLSAVKTVRESGIKIQEVYSPFPVHGLDEVLGYRRTRLPIAAFMFGLLGTSLALTMQIWMLGFDWPMIIGGKNFVSLPPFVPVTFELTVLLAALGMVGTFMIVSDLKPYKKARLMDTRITDDKHVMAIDLASNTLAKDDIKKIVNESGASEVNDKDFED